MEQRLNRSATVKLSKTQQHVIDRMREGWALCEGSGFNPSVWLQKDGCGCGGETEKVSHATFHRLYKLGLIIPLNRNYPTSCWGLLLEW